VFARKQLFAPVMNACTTKANRALREHGNKPKMMTETSKPMKAKLEKTPKKNPRLMKSNAEISAALCVIEKRILYL